MALLQMINAVRGKLREERIASISSTDLLTTEIIDLINDAGSEILEGNDWEFDVRHDGKLWFPSSQSGTDALFYNTTIIANTTAVDLVYSKDNASGEVFEDDAAIDLAGFRCSGNSMRARIYFPSSDKGQTSWIIVDVRHGNNGLALRVSNNFNMAIATAPTWTTYANELVLPTTVKDVLSVRNEEEPLHLVFVDRDMQFDQCVPRPVDRFGSLPEVVIVGGTITSTARPDPTLEGLPAWTTISPEAAVTGVGCMVWPIPNADVHLNYSYRVQHADLSAATDEWAGVPANIIHAIEWQAYRFVLDSGIQNDPRAAARAEREVERRVARALTKQSRQPNRRRIPTSFRSPHRYGSSRRRWASQTISV
jgi:hypothetical protein